MSRRELSAAQLATTQALTAALSDHWHRPRVVLGVSGGADSLTLAGAAAWVWSRRRDETPDLVATVVDHGLQEGSDAVAARTAEQVEGVGVRAEVVRVEVPRRSGPEADARQVRYGALVNAAGLGGVIMVAHTLDDQAESVLLGLARGSGLRSLAAMASESTRGGVIMVRPFLRVRRDVLVAACREWGFDPWHDPHNADPAFARVRVRHRVLPVLEDELGPGVTEALGRTARLARADAEALDGWAVTELRAARSGEGLDCRSVAALPPAVASRVVRAWLVAAGATQPTFVQVEAILALVSDWRGQGPVHVVGGEVVRRDGHLVYARA